MAFLTYDEKLTVMERVTRELPRVLRLNGIVRNYEQTTAYAFLRVRGPECVVFVSTSDDHLLHMIENSLRPRIESICKEHEVTFGSRDEKEGSKVTRTYTFYPLNTS